MAKASDYPLVKLEGYGRYTGAKMTGRLISTEKGVATVKIMAEPKIWLDWTFRMSTGMPTYQEGWRLWQGWKLDLSSLPAQVQETRRKNGTRKARPKKKLDITVIILKGGREDEKMTFEEPRLARKYLRSEGLSITNGTKEKNGDGEIWTVSR